MDDQKILDLYANYDPPGELVLPYDDPAKEPIMPVYRGRFNNISKLIFRGGTLWVISCVVTLTVTYVSLLTTPFVVTSHHSSYGRHSEQAPSMRSPARATLPDLPREKRHKQHPYQPSVLELAGYALAGVAGAFAFGGALMVLTACVYTALMVNNFRCRFGKAWKDHLASPTNLALSKACLKLIWQGRWCSQYGAMLAWQDVISLDFASPDEEHLAPRVLIKYKFPEGEQVLPFSLAAFSSPKAATVFLNTLAKWIPVEVQTDAFKKAASSQGAVIQSAQNATVDGLLAPPAAENEEQQVVALISKLSDQTQPPSEVIHVDVREKIEEPAP